MRRIALLALLAAAGAGQDAPAPEPPEPRPEVRHEVRLRSGTCLVGRLEPETWRVTTTFGELKVPVADISRVRFGRRAAPERLRQVEVWIEDFASKSPEARARARAALKEEAGFAGRALERSAKDHADPEVRRLCAELLEEMDLDPEAVVPDEDRLETRAFDLAGLVVIEAFKVTVPELGSLVVRRGDVTEVRAYRQEEIHRFAVLGGHVWPNAWLDTKVKLKKGEAFRVTADGSVVFPNWGVPAFTPEGNASMGLVNGVPMGALAARVGDAGTMFLAGRSFSGRAPNDGTLQLCMALNAHEEASTGEYLVRVIRGQE